MSEYVQSLEQSIRDHVSRNELHWNKSSHNQEVQNKKLDEIQNEINFYETYYKCSLIISLTLVFTCIVSFFIYLLATSVKGKGKFTFVKIFYSLNYIFFQNIKAKRGRQKSYLTEIDPTIGDFSNKDFEYYNWNAQSAYNYEIAMASTSDKSVTPIANLHLEDIIHSLNNNEPSSGSNATLNKKKSQSSLGSN